MADYRCARCQWSQVAWVGDDTLVCRKHPPTTDPAGSWGRFPLVRPEWWCGQFSPKRQAPWTATVEEPRGPE